MGGALSQGEAVQGGGGEADEVVEEDGRGNEVVSKSKREKENFCHALNCLLKHSIRCW